MTSLKSSKLPVEMKPVFVPPLEEVAAVLEQALKANFADAEVKVADCPDLTLPPFTLAAPGICGSPRLVDLGAIPYLIPLPQENKLYNLWDIPLLAELPGALVLGAGAGPWPYIGVNCEMMPNLWSSTNDRGSVNRTHIAMVDKPTGGIIVKQLPEEEARCAMLANLFLSLGQPGKVLRVIVKRRTGGENFVTCMRKGLLSHYEDKSVGIGGVFLIRRGKSKFHVMPAFSTTPIHSDKDVEDWLKFYDVTAPLICLSTFVSKDPGLDLRVEHTHGFSHHGEGGHYHYDVTPEEVEYEGYFSVAEKIYRIDRPEVTHQISRD